MILERLPEMAAGRVCGMQMGRKVEHLNHIYGQDTIFEQYALKDVSLTIGDGEFVGLIGHTGSGKSTLTQQLSGLLKASSGDSLYSGTSI